MAKTETKTPKDTKSAKSPTAKGGKDATKDTKAAKPASPKAASPKATAAKDTKAAPAKDSKAAPAKDSKATPAKDSKAAPAKDSKAAAPVKSPSKDSKAAPAKDSKASKAAPAKDSKAAPAKDSKATPKDSKASSPKAAKEGKDTKDASPKSKGGVAASTKDTKATLKEEAMTPTPKAADAAIIGGAVVVASRGVSSASSSSSSEAKKVSSDVVVLPSAIKRFESDHSFGKKSMDEHTTGYQSVKITVVRAIGLVKLDDKKRQAPYVVLQLGNFEVTGRTCKRRSKDPYFAEEFYLPWSTGQNLKLSIRKHDKNRSDRRIAAAKLDVVKMSALSSKTVHLALTGPNGSSGGVIVIRVEASSNVLEASKIVRVKASVSSSKSSDSSSSSSQFDWVAKTKGKIVVNGVVRDISDTSSASTLNRNKKKVVVTTTEVTTTHTTTTGAAVVVDAKKKSRRKSRSSSSSRSSKKVRKAVAAAAVAVKDDLADKASAVKGLFKKDKKEGSSAAVVATTSTTVTTTTHSHTSSSTITPIAKPTVAVVSATVPQRSDSSSSSSSDSSFSAGEMSYTKTHQGINITVMNCVYGSAMKSRGNMFVRVKMGSQSLDGRGVQKDSSFNTFFGESYFFNWNTEARLKVVLYERGDSASIVIGSGVLNLDKIYRNPGDLKLSLVCKNSEIGHLNMSVGFNVEAPETNHTEKVSFSMLRLPTSLAIGGSPRKAVVSKPRADAPSFQSSTSSSVFRDNALAAASIPYKAVKVVIFSGHDLLNNVKEAVCTLSVGAKKLHSFPTSGEASNVEFNMESLLPYRGERFIKCVVKDLESTSGFCAKGRLDLDPYLIKKVGLKGFYPKIHLVGRHGKTAGYLDMMVQFSESLVKEPTLAPTKERFNSKESLSSAGSSTKSSNFDDDGTTLGLRISVTGGEKLHVSKRADVYLKAGTEKKRVRSHVLRGEGTRLTSQVTFFLPYRSAKYATLQLYEREKAAPDVRVGGCRINLGSVRAANKRVEQQTINFEDRNGITRGTVDVEVAVLSEEISKPSVTLMTTMIAKAESASSSTSN